MVDYSKFTIHVCRVVVIVRHHLAMITAALDTPALNLLCQFPRVLMHVHVYNMPLVDVGFTIVQSTT